MYRAAKVRFRAPILRYPDCSQQGVPAQWPLNKLSKYSLLQLTATTASGVLRGFCTSEGQIKPPALTLRLQAEDILWHSLTSCPHQPLHSWDLPKSQNFIQIRLPSHDIK